MDDEAEVARLPALHALLAEPDQRTRETVAELTELTYGKMMVLGLFVATWEVYRGIRVLLERRLAEEALMLMRTLVEDTARLQWLSRDAQDLEIRAIRYGWSSAKYERDLARAARSNGWAWAEEMFRTRAEEVEALRREAQAAGLGEEPENFPKTRDLLDELGSSRLYYWYARASQSIHSTGIGISARIRPPAGDTHMIQLESPPIDVARIGVIAGEHFISALVAASVLLSWNWEEIVAFGDHFSPRAEDLFQKIAGKPVSEETLEGIS